MPRIESFSIEGKPFAEEGMPKTPEQPPRSAVLWRYMNLEKLLHMLRWDGVFFSYPGKLNDPFEGSLPTPTILRLRNVNAAEGIENSTKKGHIVSCWHEMDHESEAMWRLYAGGGVGIAVKTTFESLMNSLLPGWFEHPHNAFMAGRVTYVDYDTYDIPVLYGMPLFYKRQSFSHEREVRITCFENESESSYGATWHVNLEKLIHEIVVSPFAEEWIFQIVVEATRRFNESFVPRIRKSDITKITTLDSLLRG